MQQNGGFSFQTFSALGGAGRGLGYVGAAAASGAGDADLDPTLGMLLNKLRKRDAVTKLKVLRSEEERKRGGFAGLSLGLVGLGAHGEITPTPCYEMTND